MRKEAATAILIFANSAKQELRNKPHIGNEQLFEALTTHTLSKVRDTGLPYFHITEKAQIGSTFQQRFVNALHEVFKKGYANVIAIGNDTPHLGTKELLEADRALQSNKIVIGPSADGGIYLLGIQNADFNSSAFLELPWKTSYLYKSLVAFIANKTRIAEFNTLFDLDNLADLKLFLARFKNLPKQILELILQLLTPLKAKRRSGNSFYPQLYEQLFFNKGSPLLVANSIG